MEMNLFRVQMPLVHPFTIFRGTIHVQRSLIVELESDGVFGYGEVTEDAYYGHSFDSLTESLNKVRSLVTAIAAPHPESLWQEAADVMDGDMFALSALDIAAHDLSGKLAGVPAWKQWGLDWNDVVPSSYTIGMASLETMVAKLDERPGWSVYKIKLGSDHDLEIVQALRERTQARFRVDANCGWTADQAIENSHALAKMDVEFIEQPLPPAASDSDKRRLFEESALPIIADEDCQVESDVERCHGLYHGVNVKICKCGGLTPALRMLNRARELELQTMVGCMVETSIGISGAAQLLPLLDYADLDGAVLLADEPARGFTIDNGNVVPSADNGCGARLEKDRLAEFTC